MRGPTDSRGEGGTDGRAQLGIERARALARLRWPRGGQSDAAKAELAVPAADVLQGKTAPAAEKTLTPAQFEQRLRLHRIEVKLQQELDQRFTGRRKSNMPNLRTPSGPAPIGEGDADSDDEATSA